MVEEVVNLDEEQDPRDLDTYDVLNYLGVHKFTTYLKKPRMLLEADETMKEAAEIELENALK